MCISQPRSLPIATAHSDVLERTATVRYFAEGLSLATLLARFVTAEQQNQIAFIKTDCEGYDKEIIRGARDYLQARKPTLFAEWFAWFTPEDDDDFFRAIEEVDYVALHPRSLHLINRGEVRVPDVLCVHKTRIGEFV